MALRLISLLQLALEAGILCAACVVAVVKGRRLFATALSLLAAQPVVMLVLSVFAWTGYLYLSGESFSVLSSITYWGRIAGLAVLLISVTGLGNSNAQNKASHPIAASRGEG
jgi:hypothetical protein